MPNWYNGIEGLYSRLEKAVADMAGKKGDKQSGLSWLNYLGKHSDVPKAEMDATGLIKYLTDNQGRTLQAGDVTKYLEANRLPISEMRLGEKPQLPHMTEKEALRAAELGYDPRAYDAPQTQYQNWQLKGPKENYREFLYRDLANGGYLPNPEYLRLAREEDALITELQRPGLTDLDRYNIQQSLDDVRSNLFGENPRIPKPGNYQAPHFDDDGNGLAFHTRASDRMAGNRAVRHVDEIQSDWAQAARDRGSYDPETPWVNYTPTGDKPPFVNKVVSQHPTMEEANAAGDAAFEAAPNGIMTGHAADLGFVPATPWANEQQGIPFYTRAAMNRQIYDAAKSGKEAVTWTEGQTQVDRYPGMERPDGMRQFYDQKLPKTVAREMRRLGYDPEQLIGKTELPGEMPNLRPIMDSFSSRHRSPIYNSDVYENDELWQQWLNNTHRQMSSALGRDHRLTDETLSALDFSRENDQLAHTDWVNEWAAPAYQRVLKEVEPTPQPVWQLDLTDPTLREKILREGLPIMSLGTLGGKALYDQAQMSPLSALNPGVPDNGI